METPDRRDIWRISFVDCPFANLHGLADMCNSRWHSRWQVYFRPRMSAVDGRTQRML